MQSVDYHIFDDLLIGNFMKTTMIGQWPKTGLSPDFNPYVPKYADNGLAQSKEELDAYFRAYRKRAPFAYMKHTLQLSALSVVRRNVDPRNRFYLRARNTWRALMGKHLNA